MANIIRKNPGKTAGAEITTVAMVGVGYVGGAALTNKALPKIQALAAKPEYHPLITLGLGLLGAVYLEEKNLNAIAKGVAVNGVVGTVQRLILKEKAADIGLGAFPAAQFTYQGPALPFAGLPSSYMLPPAGYPAFNDIDTMLPEGVNASTMADVNSLKGAFGAY